MRFNAIEKRFSPASIYGSTWPAFLSKLQSRDAGVSTDHGVGLVFDAVRNLVTSCAICGSIRTCVGSGYVPSTPVSFIGVRYMMLEAYGALKKERAPLSGEDIFNLSVLRYVNARGFAQICLDEYPSLAVSDSDVISNLLSKRRSAQPVQLFAHGLNRLSILRQVLQNLRYPWPGRVATENASALIKSFWWRPPFGSDRITVFVTPDNPTLLHSLNAEFSEPFQTEWGQKLSVSFEPFHSRD